MMSNLPAQTLGDIWQLADTTKSGSLVFPEFALAMYLCSSALKGSPVPQTLPQNIKSEVEKGVDWIAFNMPENTSTTSLPAPGVTSSIGAPATNSSVASLPQQPPQQPQSTYGGPSQVTTGFAQPSQTLLQGSASSFQPTANSNQPSQQPILNQQAGVQQTSLAQQVTGYTPTLQAQSTGYTPTLQAETTGYTPTIQAQTTGYTPTIQAQTTGYTPTIQAQTTGYTPKIQAQTTGYTSTVQAQTTGYTPTIQAQLTGYTPTLQAQSTGYTPALTSQSTGYAPITTQATGYAPSLQAQPTGRPGEWGFINTPGGGLPGLDKFQSRFMPQPGQQTFTSTALEGNAKVEWAITKDEKKVYDKIFAEWDKERKGTMAGDVAIKVLTQSGLSQKDLESIWTLSDPGNKGKLDRDEFAVAMHLIYRRLNNYPIPARLPPELIPPSSQNFSDSVSQVKSYLRTSSVSSESTSVSYMKNRSFKTQTNQTIKKDATVFKNNDDEMVYRSSARHRSSRNKQESKSDEKSEKSKAVNNMSLAELRKLVHEKQILLDAIDAKDEEEFDNVRDIEDKDVQTIDTLKAKILAVQKDINTYPPLPITDKKDQERTLYAQRSKISKLAEAMRATESEIASLKLQLFRANAEKANPGSTIIGTGPGGAITDSDRRKAKSRALLKARMASLTGKGSAESSMSFEEFEAAFAKESENISKDKEQLDQTMRDIEESSAQIVRDAEGSLRGNGPSLADFGETNPDREVNRWEEAIGVEDDVKDLIYSLKRLAPYSGPMPTPVAKKPLPATGSSPLFASSSVLSSPVPAARSPLSVSSARSTDSISRPENAASSKPSTAVHRTPAERAAYIKAEAKRRMDERLAAMGISRPSAKKDSSATESPQVRSPSVSSIASSTASVPTTPIVSNPPVVTPSPVVAPVPIAPEPVAPAAPVTAEEDSDSDSGSDLSSSDDDDDEEEFKIMLQKRAVEEAKLKKLREDKAARKAEDAAAAAAATAATSSKSDEKEIKKQQKEQQMAALRAQMEAMRAEQAKLDESDSGSDEDEEVPIAQPTPQSAKVPDFSGPPPAAANNNPFLRNKAAADAAPVEGGAAPAEANAFASMLFGTMGSEAPPS